MVSSSLILDTCLLVLVGHGQPFGCLGLIGQIMAKSTSSKVSILNPPTTWLCIQVLDALSPTQAHFQEPLKLTTAISTGQVKGIMLDVPFAVVLPIASATGSTLTVEGSTLPNGQ